MDDSNIIKSADDYMIEDAFENLLTSYYSSNHRQKFDIINKAFNFANKAHKGVKRQSGEPYIMHPLAVAQIVCKEIGLGSTSISSALLHDVVEDTDYTIEDIEKLFGEKIAQIVNGLTKISGGIFAEAASTQAENMRNLLITMANDIRVIIIKIADRLHNMRTLGSLLPAKQLKIAGETMFLYAPMANRLGLFAIKTELEDLSFKYDHPEEFLKINRKLEATAANREKIYANFIAPLCPKLDELGIAYRIQERLKSVYSIWSKMQTKKIDFDAIYDIFAVRIVFEPKQNVEVKKQCWDIYSIITDIYEIHPGRIRDWVSRPKANGYQALHLTVMGKDGKWIEVQIRSEEMDEIAEKGFAAHWKYKNTGGHFAIEDEQNELNRWLERIQDVLEAPSPSAMDFLDTIKLNLYASEIFVFTPKGEMKVLPQGATALDFAYEIHSNMGNKCIGAKVNHQLVPLSYKLSSGDQVEILTSRNQSPQQEWLSYVITARAKTKIELSFKKHTKEKIKQGEEIFEEWLKKLNIEYTNQFLDKLLSRKGYQRKDDLFYAIAEKQLVLDANPQKLLKDKQVNPLWRAMKTAINVVNPYSAKENEETKKVDTPLKQSQIDRKKTFILEEEEYQKNYIAAPCCNPVPGEEVLGFIRDDKQLEIHNRDCKHALNIKTKYGNRIVFCTWAGHKSFSFPSTIEIKGIDRMGILNEITKVFYDNSVNMQKIFLDASGGIFNGTIDVIVHDIDDINQLLNLLKKIKNIESVNRVIN